MFPNKQMHIKHEVHNYDLVVTLVINVDDGLGECDCTYVHVMRFPQ